MKEKGMTIIELMIVMAVIAGLSLGAGVAISELKYSQDSKKAAAIANDINKGMQRTLLLKNSNGCNNIVSITHADLITVKVPSFSVYPAPWTTSFAYVNKGSSPTENLVAINVMSTSLAERIFYYSGGDEISGSVIYYRFPLNNLHSGFSSMYRNGTGCWSHGVGSK
ncbi:prepilin-type N-terminal cleavage/methylation domain-containing protein [Aeromonas caviae]|uniref:type II secretion system protein n=1 Tax=Aeromonas caviae TaxID=648 RepID=UPI0030D8539D